MHRNLLLLLLCGVCLPFICGCQSSGNYTYKNGVDYAALKTYALEPFSQGTLALYPALGEQAATIYGEIEKQFAANHLTPAAKGQPADLVVRLSYSQVQRQNPDVLLVVDINAQGYVPATLPEGQLAIEVVYKDIVVYRGWSPWGVNMNTFSAADAVKMVQWCLIKFPPPYHAPATPKISLVTEGA